MSDLKDQLVRLGEEHKHLRPNLRPILASLQKTSNYVTASTKVANASQMAADLNRAFDTVTVLHESDDTTVWSVSRRSGIKAEVRLNEGQNRVQVVDSRGQTVLGLETADRWKTLLWDVTESIKMAEAYSEMQNMYFEQAMHSFG